ncbi:PAS domain-containing sensor histidine kinase [Pedobacter sp. ASV12]|uniref:PAS domain-containing sensor histidine kinase n=1 Tax=Pedobacter sp. ASV12 TaxID=2795120 RepID=UPI0018ECB4A2|nr:PAS domain-containing sensor histidine kinase [Pedobacter sp. ASV12]
MISNQNLSQHSAILAAIVESSDDAIVSKDLNGIVTSWNPAAERIFGYTATEMLGQSILKIIPADRHHEETTILRILGSGGRLDHFETKRITKDKRILDVSLTISPIKNKAGEITGVSKIARDITELRKQEEKEAVLAAIIESTDDAIISKTLTGIITSWNPSAQRMFGYSSEEMIGQSILNLIPPDRKEEEPLIISKLKQGERVKHFETKRVTKTDKIIDVSLTISPIKNKAGEITGVSKIARDITEKKQEDQRKNDFMAIVSHELKTPLTSIKTYVQLLQARAKKNPDEFTVSALGKADVQIKKMTNMIHDFLNLSRLEEGRMPLNKTTFSLCELLEELILEAKMLFPGHEIVLQMDKDSSICADRDKIGQVMLNLLGNAAKYSGTESLIKVCCETGAAKVKISVSDEGMGIAPADQQKLFERFYRVHTLHSSNISGFGIGLYLVSEILKLHHSEIKVQSEPGVGSTFYFCLDHA